MAMREDCRHYESRTYANGDTVRKCNIDRAPDAPWRCPDPCASFELRIGVGWTYGSMVNRSATDDVPGLDDGSAAAILDEAEEIVNAVTAATVAEVRAEQIAESPSRRGWRRLFRRP